MKIYKGLPLQPFRLKSSIGIGVFDGVHLGHQKLIQHVVRLSQKNNSIPTIITFHPHPSLLFKPSDPVLAIESIESRLTQLSKLGVKRCILIRLNKKFASISPESFSSNVLKTLLQAHSVTVGSSFRYGKNAQGNIQTLQAQGAVLGFDVYGIKEYVQNNELISSSRIRKSILAGDFLNARRMMGGRAYTYSSTSVAGRGRGRSLGFPTINLKNSCQVIPHPGVYAGWLISRKQLLPAAIHIGTRPTFNDSSTFEVHVLQDQYLLKVGQTCRILPYQLVRQIRKFNSAELLKQAIEQDTKTIKNILLSSSALHFKLHSVY